MKRYLIEGCCDGGLFAETVDAESQEQAEELALERLKEAWREPDAESLDDLGDCATVREYSPDEYARVAGGECLAGAGAAAGEGRHPLSGESAGGDIWAGRIGPLVGIGGRYDRVVCPRGRRQS